jgi:hypothetical protein
VRMADHEGICRVGTVGMDVAAVDVLADVRA